MAFSSSLPAPAVEPSPAAWALRHAASEPDRVAVVDGVTGEQLTRADLAKRSAAVAAGLAKRGVGPGDVVAFAMPNLVRWPVIALGVWRAGALLAPLSPAWGAEETGRLVALVRPRIAIAAGPLAPVVHGALSAAGIDVEVVADTKGLLVGGTDPFGEPRLGSDDLAVVTFSSGTGGLPKAVGLTHGNLAASAAQVATSFASAGTYDADCVTLAGAPFFASMGLGTALCAPLVAGARIVTHPRPDTTQVLELIDRHRVTHATVSLTAVEEIAAHPLTERYDTSELQFVGTGGAHLPPATELQASERLDCLVRDGYGMTEATSMISGPLGRASDPETVGWLAPGTEARVVDPERGRDVAPGRPGELWIRGPQVMHGYYQDADATATTITPDGWLRTGDLVRFRDDGQLVIEDRLKELIKVRGASVAPAELELVLREHPSVRDAAVVGRPDAERGEVPVAWVVLSRPAPADELAAFVRSRVAAHKRVHDVRIVERLPRMPSGKLLRRELRRRERDSAATARTEAR
jgi:acyl-CoA synthetase (AMP-forming)/AMP-acid ligase II